MTSKISFFNFCRILMLLISVLFFAEGCGRSSALKELPPPEVVVTKVVKQAIPFYDEFSGTVQSVRVVNIVPRVSGYIQKCYFTEGTLVKEGDPLYLIDPRPFQAKLDAVQAQLKLDDSKLAFQETQVSRYDLLVKNQATSVEKYQDIVSQRDQLLAAVAKDKADIASAQLDLSFTAITAPFTGRIQKTNIDVGNLVEQQRDVLTTLIKMDPVYVYFSLSRAKSFDFQLLKRQNKLFPTDKMKMQLYLPNGSIYRSDGKIDYISYLIDQTTDCVTVRGVIANLCTGNTHDYDLIPGQYVPVKLIFGEKPDALIVPETAIVESQIGEQIYVVEKGNKVSIRNVVTGSKVNAFREITKGVSEGEMVVTQGVQKIKAGMTVKPMQAPPVQAAVTSAQTK
ncbi:MAG: hypothetical protein A2017_16335 [Lentisphaerae bacterium GWF2_44_16]|nr:MAG: hypothetical protein A2017_16335 [Lentisphaerae bacterium GWF2_44_16]